MVSPLFFFLVLTGLYGLRTQDCSQEAAIGVVVNVKIVDGQPVQIRRAGVDAWGHAESGTMLCTGDQVRARFRSRARVRFRDSRDAEDVEVTVGVNTRIRTVGVWDPDAASPVAPLVLDIVHGVVELTATDRSESVAHLVRTGPTTCSYSGKRILANWDPFKREANFLVEEGRMSCGFEDSMIVIHGGESLEIVRGHPQKVKRPVPLILDSFVRATRFD